MAGLGKDSSGWRVRFYEDGQRKTLRLGNIPKKDAVTVAHMIERLLTAKRLGIPLDSQTVGWLARISDDLHDRLARAGLVEPRQRTTLGDLLERYFAARMDVKSATRIMWQQAGADLLAFFGGDCKIANINRDAAEAFKNYLVNRRLAPSTISRRLQRARQFFTWAVDNGLIDTNPFAKVKHAAGNPLERRRYVTLEEMQRLIDAAPNWVWRTIIALCRFGGLRCPSEVLSLRWEDVDLPGGRMIVTSPKTEHHPGGGRRVVPIFVRLRPYLEEAWDHAEGHTHVIPENLYLKASRGPNGWVNCNLRTQFERIIRRAGLKPWPRLFHNLRASCETDLASEFPIATVCKWIGNTVAIAAKHCVEPLGEHFQRAAGLAPLAAPQTPETSRNDEKPNRENPVFSAFCAISPTSANTPIAEAGFEPARG